MQSPTGRLHRMHTRLWDEIIRSGKPEEGDKNGIDRETHCPEFGAICPNCGKAQLEYDGMLNLACPECQYASAAAFT